MSVTLNPQIVGQAENAHKPVLERILAGTGTTRNQWVALTLTAAAGGTLEVGQLAGRISGALKIDDVAARTAITELTTAQLLTGEDYVGLTDTGRARHAGIRASVDEVITRVYAGIAAEDLATTARVLTTITARLNTEAANS